MSIGEGTNMDTFLLSKINRLLKKERPISSQDTICTYYYENNYLEISFENGQCSNDIQGSCTMCDYGTATCKEDVAIFIEEMLRIYFSFSNIDALMLCTNGSFLDDTQMPFEFQKKIMEEANKLPCKTILIETHCCTITDSKLKLIKNTIKNKEVKIELGLETTNLLYQKYILNKNIPLKRLESIIYKIQSYGFVPSLNILVGIPFLTETEQIKDVLASIKWCLQHNTEIVLFPVNIKPYTLLYYLYQNKMYQPIFHWLPIYILSLVDEKYLPKIDIAFWGNRDDSYNEKKVIFPLSCNKCYRSIMNFYPRYLSSNNSVTRQECIHALLENADCDCFHIFKNKLDVEYSKNIEKRLEQVHAHLEQAFAGRI